jgi:orotidine-5'-phosphate decarboxylase
MVVGATWPEEMKKIREIAPSMTFLTLGIGEQGADLEALLSAGLREDKRGLIISSSRSIIYADEGLEFAAKSREKTLQLRDSINIYR